MLRCDYCGYQPNSTGGFDYNAGDTCSKCMQGILCAKGTKGNP